jgi:serine/threonine protein phosphatase 1
MLLSAKKQTLSRNTQGRDFVVGDIHGHVSKLMQQLETLDFNTTNDRLICVGDLIDRGPTSDKALALLDELWFFSVLGNHELLMVNALKYQNSKYKMMWLQQGGEWIASSDPQHWPQWFEKIEQLPLAIEIEGKNNLSYGIVHADFPRLNWDQFDALSDKELEQCIWGRSHFRERSEHTVSGIDYLIHGHNVSQGELQLGNRFYIEPGVYSGSDFIIKEI